MGNNVADVEEAQVGALSHTRIKTNPVCMHDQHPTTPQCWAVLQPDDKWMESWQLRDSTAIVGVDAGKCEITENQQYLLTVCS
jgi:hypothetical protein